MREYKFIQNKNIYTLIDYLTEDEQINEIFV